MNISLIVDILILAVLLYIAYKLYAIASAISRFLERTARDREPRDPSPSAQTINVNVSPASGGASSGAATTLPLAVSAATSQDPSSGATLPSSASQSGSNVSTPEPAAPERHSSPSGPYSTKCSRCHAENSSYRTECFNCGNPL